MVSLADERRQNTVGLFIGSILLATLSAVVCGGVAVDPRGLRTFDFSLLALDACLGGFVGTATAPLVVVLLRDQAQCAPKFALLFGAVLGLSAFASTMWGLIAAGFVYLGAVTLGSLALGALGKPLAPRCAQLCAECNYDLRGNSGGGCPECGWNRADRR